MEKILVALHAGQVNTNTIDFACHMAALTGSKLTGVILEDQPVLQEMQGERLGLATAYAGTFVATDVVHLPARQTSEGDPETLFTATCARHNIRCDVHRPVFVPVYDIIEESRFADLLIVDASLSFEKHHEPAPSGFVKDVLYYAECPVMVAPQRFTGIDEIVFAYDGSASSVFAIRQFTYLFPALEDKTATVLHVSDKDEWPVREKQLMADWLKPHYSIINFRLLKGNARSEMMAYLQGRENLMVVMGAFGRGTLSRMIRGSLAGPVLKAGKLPVFITHH